MNAFTYLIWTGGRNRFLAGLRRARSPRYAAALAVGILYIWGFLLRPVNSGAATSILLGQPTETLVTLLVVVMLSSSWLFGADATPLAFTQAELSFLFPAPLSRRALIRYKLARAQIIVLVNVLIWVFVLRRGGGPIPSGLRAISLWVFFSTLNLHRLGAAIVRSSWREHGAAGAKRNRWSIAAFAIITGAVIASVLPFRDDLISPQGFGAFFSTLSTAVGTPPASWALFPFHAVVAPTFAQTIGQWGREMLAAVGVFVLHAWWVLRTDAAFEDAAIEASAERARRVEAMRSRRSAVSTGALKPAKSSLRLAASGRPAVAVFWKNMLCLRRTAQLRVFIGPLAMAVALGAAFSADDGYFGATVARSAGILALMLLVFGGRLIRNDLRQDMQHLPFLKCLPLAADELMIAEVASAALPMAALQLLLLLIAYVATLTWPDVPLSSGARLGVILAAPFAVTVLNGALLTIQNGTVVLFPAWVRLGPAVSTGIEALGQNVLATAANLLSLTIALIVPGLIGFGTFSAMHTQGVAPVVIAIVSGALVLGAETYGMLRVLGGALAKAEPLAQ